MNWVLYLFGSGAAFFVGIGLVLASILTFTLFNWRLQKPIARLLSVVGLLLIALSAAPLPYWLYAVSGIAALIWLAAELSARPRLLSGRTWLRGFVAALLLLCAAIEIPRQFMATLSAMGHPTLYVIGDSVTAGMNGDHEKNTWPQMLAREHRVEVVDLSKAGATAASAMKQADGLPAEGGLVLVEIGGNDLLGSTTAKQFEHDLDVLCDRICNSGRAVLLFELPLPPFCNEYGRIQRLLAAKHGVLLIPKRVFIAVLSHDGWTSDSVHLTPLGHQRMTEAVWSLIQPAYGG